jgi:hypothetical protein
VPLSVGGAAIDVVLPTDLADPAKAEFLGFVTRSADTVAQWYGTFPVQALRIDVSWEDGGKVGFATTWPGRPPHIDLALGRTADRASFDRDWVLVHEMTHLAFPPVDGRHHWIEEGLATYLEPWARVAAGRLAPETAWFEFARVLHQGLSKDGLDHDGSWASTYWGGAVYAFAADLEIRRRTGNQKGLRDAVQAIAKGGGMWGGGVQDLAGVLAVGDAAVGVPVLTETWRAMGDGPVAMDLPETWAALGVVRKGDAVTFDETAPEAAIRKAIAPVPIEQSTH